MTSAEAGPLAADTEPDDDAHPAAGVEAEEAFWQTPWSPNTGRRGRSGNQGPAPASPAVNSPAQNGTAGSATQPGTAPGPGTRAPGAAAPAANTAGSPHTPPGTPAGPGATAPPAPTAAAPPAPDRPAERTEPEPGGLPVDPDMLSAMGPMALMAGAGLLPMLGSALAGLLGGGSGGGQPAVEGQMSPEAQQALEALDLLAEVYGDGPTDDPQVKKLRAELGLTDGASDDSSSGSSDTSIGSGETARMVKARQLFQKNAATAFNNLDNQLAGYVKRLAGDNSVDKKAVTALIREVNVALAELGPEAYTKEGQQKVREILTRALKKAHGIVSGGQANADDTAAAIDKLTNQYLYNIAGQDVPKGYMNFGGGDSSATAAGAGAGVGAGGSDKARKGVEVALAQIGDPYVWGAEGPNNFDCSGLTQYAAKAAGVNIPRVAADQYRSLPKVPAGQLQPGDLIFPSSSFKSDGPGHVMMYIGNGQVVHAPKTGDVVRVVALPSSYEAARWA